MPEQQQQHAVPAVQAEAWRRQSDRAQECTPSAGLPHTQGEDKRDNSSRPPSPHQLFKELVHALCAAFVARARAFGIHSLLRLPGAARGLVQRAKRLLRALWRRLQRCWVGQVSLALASSLVSVRCSSSLALRGSQAACRDGQGQPASLATQIGTTVSLLWGCVR